MVGIPFGQACEQTRWPISHVQALLWIKLHELPITGFGASLGNCRPPTGIRTGQKPTNGFPGVFSHVTLLLAPGYFYKVTTESPYGIGPLRLLDADADLLALPRPAVLFHAVPSHVGLCPRIRDEPDVNGPRTGEDLIRGAVFEVWCGKYVQQLFGSTWQPTVRCLRRWTS